MLEIGADSSVGTPGGTLIDGPIGTVLAIARGAGPVRFAAAARARIAAGHAAMTAVASAGPVYGRSTGVGANLVHLQSVESQALAAADRALLAAHATTTGPPLPEAEVRAGVAVRLCQLATGGSGISPQGADAFAGLLDVGRRLPEIGRFGAVGTGDLGPLATLALALGPGALAPGDALPLMSSGAVTVGGAVLVLDDLRNWLAGAESVVAAALQVLDGSADAWDPAAVGPDPGARRVAARLTGLLPAPPPPGIRVQDPFALRTAPQTLGLLDEGLHRLAATTGPLVTTGVENPLVLTDPPRIRHNGAFHAVRLAADLDGTTAALVRAAAGSGQRLSLLMGGGVGTPSSAPFLAAAPGGSGLMSLEYVAAAALAELRSAALPTAVHQVHVGNPVESDAGFAPQALVQAERAADAAFVVLACELVAVVRACRARAAPLPDARWAELPDDPADRDLTVDLRLAQAQLRGAGRESRRE